MLSSNSMGSSYNYSKTDSVQLGRRPAAAFYVKLLIVRLYLEVHFKINTE